MPSLRVARRCLASAADRPLGHRLYRTVVTGVGETLDARGRGHRRGGRRLRS